MSDPVLLLEDGDLVVMYIADERRNISAMTIFSTSSTRNLAGGLGAIKNIAPGSRVRYRPAQGSGKSRQSAHVIVNFAGELAPDIRVAFAGAFVEAIKLLG